MTKEDTVSQRQAAEAEALQLNQRVAQLGRQGKIVEAIPLARRSLELSEQIHGKVHRNVSADLITLADLYRQQADYFNAEPLVARAIEIDKQLYGPQHPEVAVDMGSLAMLHSSKGDKDAAVRTYREALAMLHAAPDASDYIEHAAEMLYGFGQTLLDLDQYDTAMAQYQSAEQFFEGTDPARAVRILIEMAEIDRTRGNQGRAKAWLDRAAKIQER